jgi:hypothetical protein
MLLMSERATDMPNGFDDVSLVAFLSLAKCEGELREMVEHLIQHRDLFKEAALLELEG